MNEHRTDSTSPNDLGRRWGVSIPELSVWAPQRPKNPITEYMQAEWVPRWSKTFELTLVISNSARSAGE